MTVLLHSASARSFFPPVSVCPHHLFIYVDGNGRSGRQSNDQVTPVPAAPLHVEAANGHFLIAPASQDHLLDAMSAQMMRQMRSAGLVVSGVALMASIVLASVSMASMVRVLVVRVLRQR